MLGNFLEHYDQTLFGLVAPCFAAFFFSDLPLISGLIATFAIASLGLVTYPLGSLFWGRIGDLKGRETALFFTMMGMALATAAIGSLPTSYQSGAYAWVLLALLRALQDFFISGESRGSAIFLLEQFPEKDRGLMSSLCDASAMLGILAASGLVTLFSTRGLLEDNWRWLFWLGGSTALAAIILRATTTKNIPVAAAKKENWFTVLKMQKKPLIAIILASGFSYTTYTFPFPFMTNFAPLISECSSATMLKHNTFLLILDFLLLPLFGLLSKKFSGIKMMGWAAFAIFLFSLPLFSLLAYPTEGKLLFVRIAIITLGVAFAAPFYMWTLSIVPKEHRYTVISFGYAIGSKLFGIPGVAISFWLYKKTGSVLGPAAYLCAIGAVAAFTIWRTSLKEVAVRDASVRP